jgi:hypothetical protein
MKKRKSYLVKGKEALWNFYSSGDLKTTEALTPLQTVKTPQERRAVEVSELRSFKILWQKNESLLNFF